MTRQYILLALRHLMKNRVFSGIKILGLTLASASILIIYLYIQHELNYDHQHAKGDRIVKADMEYRFGGETVLVNVTGNKLATAFTRDFAEIESAVRVIQYNQVVRQEEKLIEEKDIYYADSTFFSVFTFPLKASTGPVLLNRPNQIVLSERMSQKYFGNNNPIGQSLKIGNSDFQITGIMYDPPAATHLKPSMVASFISLPASLQETWWNANYATYFLLHPNVDVKALEKKIPEYMKLQSGETRLEGDDYVTFKLDKFFNLHLKAATEGNFEPAGDIRYLYILGLVGIMIMAITIITYVNLTTSENSEKIRETGIQKTLGAPQWQLILQNMLESSIISLFSFAAGLILAVLLLPGFNSLFDRQLHIGAFFNTSALLVLVGLPIVISLLCGIYPALTISAQQPVMALKQQQVSGTGSGFLKKSLMTFQFVVTVILIISTLTVYRQMTFIRDKKLGFDKDQVIVLPADRLVNQKYASLKTQLLNQTGVDQVTLSYDLPTEIKGGYSAGQDPTGRDEQPVIALPAGLDFLSTMNIPVLAGSDFTSVDIEIDEKLQKDTSLIRSILINQKMLDLWNLEKEGAIGKRVIFNGRPADIKAVISDFHFASLHKQIQPLVIFASNGGRYILIKLQGTNLPTVISQVENIWKSVMDHRPFSFHFLDDELDRMYSYENQNAQITYLFTLLAIFLSFVGLFGVVSFGFSKRKKELSLRKILGAPGYRLFELLAREYLWMILVGLLISIPVAGYFMNQWLTQFYYRVSLSWWIFILAGLISFAIGILSMTYHGLRAAYLNPVDNLKEI